MFVNDVCFFRFFVGCATDAPWGRKIVICAVLRGVLHPLCIVSVRLRRNSCGHAVCALRGGIFFGQLVAFPFGGGRFK